LEAVEPHIGSHEYNTEIKEIGVSRSQGIIAANAIGNAERPIHSGKDALYLDRVGPKTVEAVDHIINVQGINTGQDENQSEDEVSSGHYLRSQAKQNNNNNNNEETKIPQENIELAKQFHAIADGKLLIDIGIATSKAREMANKIETSTQIIRSGKEAHKLIGGVGIKTQKVIDMLLGNNNNNNNYNEEEEVDEDDSDVEELKNQDEITNNGNHSRRSRRSYRKNRNNVKSEENKISNELQNLAQILKQFGQGKSDHIKIDRDNAIKYAEEIEVISQFIDNNETIRSKLFAIIQ